MFNMCIFVCVKYKCKTCFIKSVMRMLNTCAVFMCFTRVGIFLCVLHMSLYLYPSQTKFGGGYIRFTLSYCLSVWLPSVNMILSTHVLGNGSIDFSENLYTNYLSFEDVHLEFSYSLGIFFHFKSFFSVFGLTRLKYCLKNYEELWFKHWTCVVLELKLCFYYYDLQYF